MLWKSADVVLRIPWWTRRTGCRCENPQRRGQDSGGQVKRAMSKAEDDFALQLVKKLGCAR